MTGATRWGLRLLACGITCGVLAGAGCAVALRMVLADSSERVKTLPVAAVIHAP